MDGARRVFSTVQYAYASVPTYPSGQIGFIVCSKEPNKDLSIPVRSFSEDEEERLLKYYNAEVHKAAFVLPSFAKRALAPSTL
jgi:spermidine synthase